MKRKSYRSLNSNLAMLLFSFPALFLVSVVSLLPFSLNAYFALFNWNGISRSKVFVGLQNFVQIFSSDTSFRSSVLFTLRFTLFYVIIINALAILLALVLSRSSRIAHVFRSFFFTPYIISLVAISLIWKCILGPGFNHLHELSQWNIFALSWLGAPKMAFFTLLLVTVWQNIGYYMLLYIAGFTAIPQDILEAASVDGASGWKKFRAVELPLLMPALTISIFTALTYSFKLFDIVLVLTKGGPAASTASIAFNIYTEAFAASNYGLATAKSLVFFFMVLLVTIVQLKLFKSGEVSYG